MDKPFISFREVVKGMGAEAAGVPLASFHSVSKGFLGECGQRGGYYHVTNFPEDVLAQLYKLASISLCSNVTGQLTVGLMVNPPRDGDASYGNYVAERDSILESLKRRAVKIAAALNELEGVSCQPVEGALYAFPQIKFPAKAIDAAKEAGKPADTFYALQLLDATGICVVPGTGFSQKPGTFHYRTTILPSEADMDSVIESVKKFHKEFMAKYQ
jgi:alanine transaminase